LRGRICGHGPVSPSLLAITPGRSIVVSVIVLSFVIVGFSNLRLRRSTVATTAVRCATPKAPRAAGSYTIRWGTTQHNAHLRDPLAETGAAPAATQDLQRRLERSVSQARREKFGTSSGKPDPDQFNLPITDV
jgi:hypothetical protein